MKELLLIVLKRNCVRRSELSREISLKEEEVRLMKIEKEKAKNNYEGSVALLINEHGMTIYEINALTEKL